MAAQQKVELFSGRVKKIKPTNVSEQRYDFLKLSEAEPDLGVPVTTDSADVKRILLTDKNGKRYWSDNIQVDDKGDLQTTGQVQADEFHTDKLLVTDNGLNARFANDDINLTTSGDLQTTGLVKFNSAMGVKIGNPDQPGLTSRAVTMTTATPVSRGMAQMNFILGKLVPKPPPDFPKLKNGSYQTIAIKDLEPTLYRLCNFVQTDNTVGQVRRITSVTSNTTINRVRRTNTYETTSIVGCGSGDQGTVTIYKNGVAAGSRIMTDTLQEADNEAAGNYLLGNDSGNYADLRIRNDQDFSKIAVPAISPLFWQSFDAFATGTVSEGWNEVYISHSYVINKNDANNRGFTDPAYWYYDASNPGAPVFTNESFTPPSSPVKTFSSTIPHYNNTNDFTLAFNIGKLSGDFYPNGNTFITGVIGGAFDTIVSMTYSSAGITLPLERNYLSASSLSLQTTSRIKSGFGSSNGSITLKSHNTYAEGTKTFTPSGIVLFKTGNTTNIDEGRIPVSTNFGSGSGQGQRIVNPGNTDTPSFSPSATLFDSKDGPLQNYDAVVVGNNDQGILKHDITDYGNYLPAGPNLNIVGRNGSQYFTFKFVKASISKFNINVTGSLAGLWVALPGSVIQTNINNWLSASLPNIGGIPGTGAGANQGVGASVGGNVQLNSNITQSVTLSFGTVSTSSTATNEIYLRIKLTAGQTITSLSISEATN